MRSTCFLLPALLLFSVLTCQAQDKFCNVWYTEGGESKVQIYLTPSGIYQGKIVWLKNGIVKGKPLIDTKNPDAAKRNKPWLGLQIINGLVKKSATEIVGGKIYDPSHGNYYNCKMTLKEPNKLELRGYILGMPFLGRTTTWYLAEDEKKTEPARAVPASATSVDSPAN
ncbi:MAG TPA: DUF2147 domain-containing protein [Chitinophagales bacterium]|nr:DUF2147 domain-containing protein [Chitinophagales bacterium]